jgi:NAD(P) transhydrogenase subunit alpha
MNRFSLAAACGVLLAGLWIAGSAWGQEPAAAEPGPAAWSRQETLIASLTIFVLAIFVGFEVITKVPPTLHTPLMSGSNAISGITLVGALVAAGTGQVDTGALLGLAAVVLASINVVGGFLVTHRMLSMFRRK